MDVAKFSRFTPGVHLAQQRAPQPWDVPQLGRVTKVTAAGAWFELLSSPGNPFGPAPWGLGSYATVAAAITAGWKPLVGDTCLAVFAGIGPGSPVVLAWWR
jgi:hypothetical protein